MDELLRRQGASLELSRVGSVILEGNLRCVHSIALGDGDQTSVTDGDAVDVRRQIFESGLPIAHPLAVHYPVSPPNLGWDLGEENSSLKRASEGSPEQFRKRLDWQEEVSACGQPALPIATQPTAGHQVMHMGMVRQVACPGMQHAHQPDLPTHKTRISGQLLCCQSRSAEEQTVDQLLVLAGEFTQLGWEREGQQEVRDGQQQTLLHFQPILGLFVLALGAMAVSAGMIAVTDFSTGGAGIDLPAQRLCAATFDGFHGLAVTGQQACGIFLAISGSGLAKDVCQF